MTMYFAIFYNQQNKYGSNIVLINLNKSYIPCIIIL